MNHSLSKVPGAVRVTEYTEKYDVIFYVGDVGALRMCCVSLVSLSSVSKRRILD